MLQFIADLSGFTGSGLLAWPALRLSNYLKKIKRVENIKLAKEGDDNPLVEDLLSIMKGQASEWNSTDHNLLKAGFSFLLLSFFLDMVPVMWSFLKPILNF